ncbi:hypothetical protein ACQJBY_010244 [Aegilops geniculata]
MKDNGWYMAEHREQHNHSMFPDYGQIIHWPSYKHIDMCSRDLVKQLRNNDVNLAKVYVIVGRFSGSMENVSFTKKALKNLCGKVSSEQTEDDVQKTMEVFADLSSKHPHLHTSFCLTRKHDVLSRISVVSLTRTVLKG